MLRVASLVAALLAGCIGTSPLSLPPEASEAQSALIAVAPEEGAQIFAVDLAGGAFPPITTRDEPLYLFLYGTDLATLGIPPGLLARLGEAEDGRPLPSGSIYVAMLPDTVWSLADREALPPSIRDFRLPDLSLGACEEAGGCFRIREGDEHCQLPCVEPERADPMPARIAEYPLPPELAPCREGWRELGPSGARPEVLCAPMSLACRFPSGTQYLGDTFCSTAGGVCPDSVFAEDLPPVTRWFVLAGANGTGTMADPFGSIQEAIAAASDGDVIAVGKGSYEEPISIDRAVSVIGACGETNILSAIDVSANASLASLAVTPGFGSTAVQVLPGAVATLTEVVVSSAAVGLGVVGSLRGSRVLIDSVQAGIEVWGDAALDRAIVRGARLTGVGVHGTGVFTNLRVSSSSTALVATRNGSLQGEGVHLASNRVGAVARGTIELDGASIARSSDDALIAGAGGSLTVRKIHVFESYQSLCGAGGDALLEHAYLERPAMHHVESAAGGRLTLRRAVLAASRRFGIHATAGTIVLEDVQIRDNEPTANDGEGIVINGPAVLESRKLAIERVFDFGIRVLSTTSKAELRLDDLTLRDIAGGYGIEMGRTYAPAARSTLVINRLFGERIEAFAVRTVSGEANEINDLVLRDLSGGGVSSIGGVLTINRAELSRIAEASLSVTSGEMLLNDLRVIDPENGLVTEGWIPTDVSAIDSAMNVNRFAISGASGAGVLIRQFSRMTFGAGRIHDNQVGVEVRADGFIYSNLEGDVIYRGNVMHNLLKLGQMPR